MLLLQVGTNVVNEIYDVRKGVDSITSPRASHAIVKGRLTERAALLMAGIVRARDRARPRAHGLRGWPIVVLGLVGLIGG